MNDDDYLTVHMQAEEYFLETSDFTVWTKGYNGGLHGPTIMLHPGESFSSARRRVCAPAERLLPSVRRREHEAVL